MTTIPRTTPGRLIRLSLPIVGVLLLAGAVAAESSLPALAQPGGRGSRRAVQLDRFAQGGTTFAQRWSWRTAQRDRIDPALATGSARAPTSTAAGPAASRLRRLVLPAQADAPQPSPPDKQPLDEQTKRKARSAVLLLSVVAGIALSGLLIIIVAITVRGLRRKLAGPTRLDQQPQDILPDASSPPHPEAPAPAEPSSAAGSAAQETHFT